MSKNIRRLFKRISTNQDLRLLKQNQGKKSFETFSNVRSVMEKSNLVDIFARYPPCTKFKENIIKLPLR
jgi:transposase